MAFFLYFDFILILFILTMDFGNEDNFILLSIIFGFFADFTRDAFYGPGVILFMLFYLVRFRTDVIMDMTKVYYRLLMFSSVSFIYCMFNLLITEYSFETALPIAVLRTIINVSLVFVIHYFFKGFGCAFKNS